MEKTKTEKEGKKEALSMCKVCGRQEEDEAGGGLGTKENKMCHAK